MKADEEHRVPLPDEAVKVLEAVQGLGHDLVFPASKRGKDGAEKEMSDGAVGALMKRMGRDEGVPHGFRSSFRSWAQERRHEAHEVLEMCLAHRTGNAVSQATRISRHLRMASRTRARAKTIRSLRRGTRSSLGRLPSKRP